jgi:nucleotide-binding universal stress UspA family protein
MTAVPITEGKAEDNAAADDIGPPILVVGIDGSPPSWDAFAWAAGEARRYGGRIVAVFATVLIEPEEAFGTTAPIGYAAAEEAREQMAEELAAEVARRADTLGV